jgi:hypothetical protein
MADLVRTDAERACREALLSAAGDHRGPMERHCVRVFRIAERMGEDLPDAPDREVMLCAAFVHDIGLFPAAATGDVYVTDGRRLAEELLAPFGWERERLRRCLDAIELHHAPRALWGLGAEVELIRRADLVDASGGLVRFGLPRLWLRSLFAEVPRDGLYGMQIGRAHV